jgi:hypothetical protein
MCKQPPNVGEIIKSPKRGEPYRVTHVEPWSHGNYKVYAVAVKPDGTRAFAVTEQKISHWFDDTDHSPL